MAPMKKGGKREPRMGIHAFLSTGMRHLILDSVTSGSSCFNVLPIRLAGLFLQLFPGLGEELGEEGCKHTQHQTHHSPEHHD